MDSNEESIISYNDNDGQQQQQQEQLMTTTNMNCDKLSSPSNNDQSSHNRSEFLCGVVEGFYGRPWTLDQRKDLFVKLRRFGMNVYMYAPKDDLKHRNLWRELYTVEESEQLSVLISNSKSNNVIFVYAISPGLDIGYSNPKDIQALKRKLDQVKQIGCEAFALLFDDIEPELNENDREAFKSFASAQVAVTNDVYQHLDQPKFLFCPTEYCSSRAVPNVQNSDYLQTIGAKLFPEIGIMWTGNRVISQSINVQQIQELTDVLRRKPIIWDNLHANDYDQKRLFLGPYCDRSTRLIPLLSGVLTNPNCEYEANFIPIHTLGQWSKCTKDAKNIDYSSSSSSNAAITMSSTASAVNTNSDIKLESESENGSIEDIPIEMEPCVYHHRNALRIAIQEWIHEFYKVKNPQIKQNVLLTTTTTTTTTNNVNNVSSTTTILPNIAINYDSLQLSNDKSSTNDSMIDADIPIESDIATNGNNNSKDNDNVKEQSTTPLMEPMDCNPSQDDSKIVNNSSTPPITDVPMIDTKDEPNIDKNSSEEMQTEIIGENNSNSSDNTNTTINDKTDDTTTIINDKSTMLTYDDIALLVDLFYLPFEHGAKGIQILQEFHWLKSNGFIVSEYRRKCQQKITNDSEMQQSVTNSNNNDSTTNNNNIEINEWYERASKFNDMTLLIGRLLTRLTFCKNRSLLYELYPYVWDIKGVISLLNSYVKWIALGRIPMTNFFQPLGLFPATFTWFSKGYREAFQSGDQEPWLFRGGLTGELQRMLPVESVSDLFLYKAPESPTSRIYTIRPYLPSDVQSVYEICFKNYDHHIYLEDQNELVGDRLIGAFLTLSPEYCFVVEDDTRLCGYALAVLDAKKFFQNLQSSWIPELLKKYPLLNDKNDTNNANNNDSTIDDNKSSSMSVALSSSATTTTAEQRSLKEKYIGQFVDEMHMQYKQQQFLYDPDELFNNYPSSISLAVMSNIVDLSVPKRMLACVIAALKANGSKGLYCRIGSNDKKAIDFYLKLGFQIIQLSQNTTGTEDIYVGRII